MAMPAVKEKLCPQFGICGGCQIQDQPYEIQLKKKEKLVKDNLQGLPVESFHPILPSPQTYFYRNKMEYSFGDEKDLEILERGRRPSLLGDPGLKHIVNGLNPCPTKPARPVGGVSAAANVVSDLCRNDENLVHLGLHPKGRFALVTPTFECLLQSEESRKILRLVADWATKNQIPVYVRKNHSGILRHLVIREGKNTGERMVNLFTTSEGTPIEELAALLTASGVPIATFIWTVNAGISDIAKGEPTRIFWGEGFISEKVGRVTLKVAPNSFMQTNTLASEKMITLLGSWQTEDSGAGILFDLYCGSGAIGLNLAEGFKEVIGIESNEIAVRDAVLNAEQNGLKHVKFIHGQVEKQLSGLMEEYSGCEKIVVVDPPRAGLHSKTVEAILDGAPKFLYYVSCNSQTLSRDLQLLGSKYRILDVQPMDFFPHTDHVETAVRLRII